MEKDKERAGIFDALAHPTRISIVKALQEENLTFADLKKRMKIESSGHLQHHLSKLDDLIKTDEHGKYCLSEHGKDALFVVETVERVTEPSKKGAVHSGSFRMRTFLTSAIVLLTVASLASSLYLFNFGVIQSQYFYNVVRGSPLQEDAYSRTELLYFFDVPSGHTYNFTAMVFSTLNPPGISLGARDYGTFVVDPPTINETYYHMGFIGFRINTTADAKYFAYFGPITGPNNTEVRILADPREAPPYRTYISQPQTHGILPHYEAWEFYIPVMAFGNYTFHIANVGNTTIRMRYEAWSSTVTMETRPLTGNETFQAVPTRASEKIVRILWKPTSLYLVAITIAVGCLATVATLSVYILNRQIYIRHH